MSNNTGGKCRYKPDCPWGYGGICNSPNDHSYNECDYDRGIFPDSYESKAETLEDAKTTRKQGDGMSVQYSQYQEYLMVENLCEQIGYGNVMDIASVLWAKKLLDKGEPTTAAFYPTILTNMKEGSELSAYAVDNRCCKLKMLDEWGWVTK